ncbi:MAG TPA: adenylate/guanylate cyclase domain-containing protein [Chloroflexota bacterium]|nr:adenylate/guanylate cyclase domain-containing protein [Chloroflexota bacterium]
MTVATSPQAATAIAPTALEQRVFQLETLYEIGRECARVERLDDALHIVLSMVMGAFGATAGRIELRDARGAEIASLRRGAPIDGEPAVSLSFAVEGSRTGTLALGTRLSGEPYAADERSLLETIAANAAVHLGRIALLATLQLTAAELARKVKALAVVNEITLGIASRPGQVRLRRFLCEKVAAALDADVTFSDEDAGPSDVDGSHVLTVTVRYGDVPLGILHLRRTPAAAAFDDEDRALLTLLANEVAVVLENARLFDTFLTQQQEQFRLRGVLEQYLAPSVAERLIAGDIGPPLKGKHCPMSLVRVDVRNSTELVRSLDVDEMVDLMNQLIGRMVDVLFRYEATIDRYDGDAVIGFFGAPEAHDDDPVRAVRTGLSMLRSFDVLRAEWETRYTLPDNLGIGVGIATGDVVVGNIGSTKRLHYTTSGLIANLAARLMAKAPRGHVLMDECTWRTVQDPFDFPPALRARRPRYLRAKGFAQLVPVYRLRPGDLPHLMH